MSRPRRDKAGERLAWYKAERERRALAAGEVCADTLEPILPDAGERIGGQCAGCYLEGQPGPCVVG